mgnify:CR=1 FL=1
MKIEKHRGVILFPNSAIKSGDRTMRLFYTKEHLKREIDMKIKMEKKRNPKLYRASSNS